jgi:hypothetical protein
MEAKTVAERGRVTAVTLTEFRQASSTIAIESHGNQNDEPARNAIRLPLSFQRKFAGQCAANRDLHVS